MNKANYNKISNHQLFAIVANVILGGSFVVIASPLAVIAKQDAWISPIITFIIGIPILLLYWYLGSKYPNKTYIEIINDILGKWIGFPTSIILIFFYCHFSSQITWYNSNFLITVAMPETPQIALNLLFVTAIVVATLYGVDTIARFVELSLYFSFSITFLTLILLLPNAKIDNLQPMLENGIVPSLKGAIFLSSFTTYSIIHIMMIYPIDVKNIKEAKNQFLKGYLFAGLALFSSIIVVIMVFGSLVVSKYRYPLHEVAKEIDVGIVFTRLEFLTTLSWLSTQFMICLFTFYSCVIGISKLFGLKDYKKIVVPLGLIVLGMAEIVFPNVVYQVNWLSVVWPPYIFTIGVLLPVILLIVRQIKIKLSNST